MFKNSAKRNRKSFISGEKVEPKQESVYNLITSIKYNNIDHKIVGMIKEVKEFPQKGDILNILTTRANSIVDFAVFFKGVIEELVVITATINQKSIDKIKGIKNKYLVNRDDTVKKQQKIYNECLKEFKKVVVNPNHTKMLLIKEKDNFYVIEASGNASNNAPNEFYNIMNNKKLYGEIFECLKIKD